MRLTSRTTAILAGITLLAAACGGSSGDAGRSRLGGGATSTTSVPVAAPSSSEGSSSDDAAADVVEQSASAAVQAPKGSAAESAAPRGGSAPVGRAERAAPAAAVSSSADVNRAVDRSGAGEPSASGSGGAQPAPDSVGSPDPGSRTGVTDAEVLFGMHLPQSGPVGFLAGKAWHGADAYFRSVNAAGGIHGRRVRMVVSDDGYSAQKAAGAIRELVDTKKVFAASCLAGIDQCVVGLEYANAKGVPYLHGGMSEVAVADKTWAYPVTSSYAYGAERLVDYLFTARKYTPSRKIGALHVNSPHYEEMARRMEQRLAHYGSRFVIRQTAEKDQSDFSAAIVKMQNAGVDTLWFFIDPTLLAKFTTQAKALRFEPQYVFSPPTGGDLFAAATGGNLDGAFGLATFADPQWSGAARFREHVAAAYPDDEPNEFDVLSYTVAQAFVEGLRRAGPDLGRDAFARGMSSIDAFDTGVSSPLSYTTRHRLAAANSALAVWQVKGTKTDQLTGFDF